MSKKEYPRRLYRKESKEERMFVRNNIINPLHKMMKNDENNIFSFEDRLAGSVKNNICVIYEDKKFDLDYQLLLNNKFFHNENATKTHQDFEKNLRIIIKKLNKEYEKKYYWKVANSTSAFTIHKFNFINQELCSYDLAILKLSKKTNIVKEAKIIKRNDPNNISGGENYQWNLLSDKYGCLMMLFKNLKWLEKKKIRDSVVEEKIKQRKNELKKSSSVIFLEKISKYMEKNNGHK